MIQPTVGRVVWYYPHGMQAAHVQPHAALIAYVHNDNNINIAYFDSAGTARNATSVRLRQGNEEAPRGSFCDWMPYQKGQAAKTEALEKELTK